MVWGETMSMKLIVYVFVFLVSMTMIYYISLYIYNVFQTEIEQRLYNITSPPSNWKSVIDSVKSWLEPALYNFTYAIIFMVIVMLIIYIYYRQAESEWEWSTGRRGRRR